METEIRAVFDGQMLEKYAAVLCWGLETSMGRNLVRGDPVLVRFDPPALAAAEALYALLVDRGLNVSWRMNPTPGMEHSFYTLAGLKQLVYETPGEYELYSSLSGMIRILAPESLGHLACVDPEVIRRADQSRKSLRVMRDKRESMGVYAWTLGAYPTPALALAAGMGEGEYAESMARACLLTRADPVREWRDMHRQLDELKRWLNGLRVKAFHVQSETTDLEVPFGDHRRWLALTGQNIPSYELYFSPDWRGVRGVYYSDLPSIRRGGVVRGVRLEFSDGQAVKADAECGLGFLLEDLSADMGAAKVGEFSLTDARLSMVDRFMGMTMFDENYGGDYGNCHIALGAGYPGTYDGNFLDIDETLARNLGFNRSLIHWDLVNTEKKTVTALLAEGGKQLIYEDGRFVY